MLVAEETSNDVMKIIADAEDCPSICQLHGEGEGPCGRTCTKVKAHHGSHYCHVHGTFT